MIPVLTPEEMAQVDSNAPESIEVLIDRAATKVAAAAIDLMGGTYGRRVVVVAGPGNNGADGRVAAEKLRARGARIEVIEATDAAALGRLAGSASRPAGSASRPASTGTGTDAAMTGDALGSRTPIDLVIDAAFGTGFRGEFEFPDLDDVPILSVDIPSGVSGLTGEGSGRPPQAIATVTFAALKPGLLFADGASMSGQVRLVDIGLDVRAATVHLVEDSDLAGWLPRRPHNSHKWNSAVWVFAGSPGMNGAARLCCSAAFRAGAGYVRHTSTAAEDSSDADSTETVFFPLDVGEWADALEEESERFGAVVIGPGIGRDDETAEAVRAVAGKDGFALLIDGDGLSALGDSAAEILAGRTSPTVLTPHDGEFERLTGNKPHPDRIAAARRLASDTRATVLLKGSTTVVASPDGSVLLSNTGDARLATAGTGDVLSGIIAAHLAQGLDAAEAAAGGAFIHGRAAALGPDHGLIASDVVTNLGRAYSELRR